MKEPFNPLESPNGRSVMNIPLSDGTNEQVTIIVVHKDRPDLLSMCLQSIHSMSNFNNYECIVVDNGSEQETQEYLDVIQAEGIKVIRNTENKFWSHAANQGVKAADPHSKYFVFMHADTVVLDQSWLDILTNISSSSSAGLVGTKLSHYYIAKQKVEFVQEHCLLMTRQCYEDCGPWPEELPLVGMSFIMTLRAAKRGHNPQATGNNIVHHYAALSIDATSYERMAEEAMGIVGKLYVQAQNF